MDRIWAPWRMEYIKKSKSKECIFCMKAESKNDKENLVLLRGEESFVLMNLYPYTNGHLMVSTYKHTSDINDISEVGNQEIMEFTNKSIYILKKIFDAEGFNFGANLGKAAGAGIEEHIHFHIVPRWIGDTNFMPTISQTKVMIEGLNKSWERLKPEFDLISKF